MCVAALPHSPLLPPIPLLSYEPARVCRCMGRRNFILLLNVTLLMAEETITFIRAFLARAARWRNMLIENGTVSLN